MSNVDWNEWILQKNDEAHKEELRKSETVGEALEKGKGNMYFGGESTKTSRQGENRGGKGVQMNTPHYDYDTSDHWDSNHRQLQAHDIKHKIQRSPAERTRYLNNRKAYADSQEKK